MIDGNTFLFYLYDGNNPKACLAFERLFDKKYKVAMSYCSNKDRFVKKIARNIALGRLEKSEILSIDQINNMEDNFINKIINHCMVLLNRNIYISMNESRLLKFWHKIRDTEYRLA